jgi:hypothetical protein
MPEPRHVWIISPCHDSDYDSVVMPANTDEDHEAAESYAIERLAELFDGTAVGDYLGEQRVTFERRLERRDDPTHPEARDAEERS